MQAGQCGQRYPDTTSVCSGPTCLSHTPRAAARAVAGDGRDYLLPPVQPRGLSATDSPGAQEQRRGRPGHRPPVVGRSKGRSSRQPAPTETGIPGPKARNPKPHSGCLGPTWQGRPGAWRHLPRLGLSPGPQEGGVCGESWEGVPAQDHSVLQPALAMRDSGQRPPESSLSQADSRPGPLGGAARRSGAWGSGQSAQ